MLDNEFFLNTNGGIASPIRLDFPSGRTAGGVYMARLGQYMFSLDTAAFTELQRQTEVRWQAVNRIGRAPAMQMTGLGEDTIELSGTIYPHFRGGVGQLGLMRDAALAGEPLPLIYAFDQVGQYCGLWCIKSLKEGRSEFFREGLPRKIAFTMSLVAYGEDEGGEYTIEPFDLFADFVTAITPPALMGSLSDEVNQGALDVAALPVVSAASELSDIRRVSAALLNTANTVASVANDARTKIANAVNDVSGALLPADVRQAGVDLIQSARTVTAARYALAGAFSVFQDAPELIAAQAGDFATTLSGVQRAVTTSGGIVKSGYLALTDLPGSVTSAVAAGSLSRSADHLLFASSECAAQAASIVGKITNG